MSEYADILDPPLRSRDRRTVLGLTGSGKSDLLKRVILPEWPRVIVLDIKGEYLPDHPDAPDGMRVLQRVTVDELVRLAMSDDPAVEGELAISVCDWGFTRDEWGERFKEVAGLLPAFRDVHLIIEECGLLPRTCHSTLEGIACISREWGVPITMVAQRAVMIPKTARDQSSRIVSFRQNTIDDAAALRDLMGDKASEITRLPRYKYVAWHESENFATPDDPTPPETTPDTAPKAARKVARTKRTVAKKSK